MDSFQAFAPPCLVVRLRLCSAADQCSASDEIDVKLLGTVLVSTLCGAFFGYSFAVARSVFPQLSVR